ncbi:hypothetical protein [Bacillus sp. 1P06AnD]|uniref:hypothetical protein n=1 Tax=Bacillus sp. 1P06AnD TaxID=3132208 RepID=UPI0039A158CD
MATTNHMEMLQNLEKAIKDQLSNAKDRLVIVEQLRVDPMNEEAQKGLRVLSEENKELYRISRELETFFS